MKFIIDHTQRLTLDTLEKFYHDREAHVELSPASRDAISECRNYLDRKLAVKGKPIYGVNTGFGSLCNIVIPESQIEELQSNLVKSHACGMGEEVPQDIVRLMLFLKIQSLAYGKSGVRLETVERLCDLINHKIHPVVFKQGSLGASGDLAPLAHLCLPLLGLGQVNYHGSRLDTATAFGHKDLKPVKLASKEGLALLNGTQFMSAYGVAIILRARHLLKATNAVTAMTIDAFDGRPDPFVAHLHHIRPHAGQVQTARAISSWLKDSVILGRDKAHVQDPYSLRCVPQVHGASIDACRYVTDVFETEINSVTDNPTIFPEHDQVLSGGNFHGQPLALALDFLSIALSELASISERRTYLLISGQRGLPPFLTSEPGLNSGFMIPQYTAAAIVSQNKQLCTPASIDSIMSSNGQEDHVSMGANAATKCFTVLQNTERVLAIELLNAAQALDYRRPLTSSPPIEAIHAAFRRKIMFVKSDQVMAPLMEESCRFLRTDIAPLLASVA